MKITIYYDGDCPFCSRYVQYSRFKETVDEVETVDLRKNRGAYARLTAKGFDLDEGMVAELEGRLHEERPVKMFDNGSYTDPVYTRVLTIMLAEEY